MRKAIVSGAAGFIGNAVARYLIDCGVDVTAVVRPETVHGNEAFRLNGLKANIIECDLREIERLPTLLGDRDYEVFYQFAWDGLDQNGIVDCERQIDNIRWGVKSVEAAAALHCEKYVGAGSVTQLELLDHGGRLFTGDRHKYFRVAQLACETMGRAAARENGIQFIWPIIINVYGEGEIMPRLVTNTIRNLLEKKHISFSSGDQLYDFLHIEDAARAFFLIGENGKPDVEYIVGSGTPRPLRQYLEIIRDVIDPDEKLGLGELPYAGLLMTEKMLDTNSLVADTGFVPQISFEDGIKRTLDWIVRGGIG